jgi:putative nucleotidyltransferase with HDIG domain
MQISKAPTKSERIQINWLKVYTNTVSLIGGLIVITALVNLPPDLVGLAVFAVLVILAELFNVELFHNSRGSSVSVSMVVTMAAILAMGPQAGVLIEVVSASANSVNSYIFKRGSANKNPTAWFRVFTFNTGMFVISTACAGYVFLGMGGRTSNLIQMVNLLPLGLAVLTSTFVNLFLLMTVISLQNGVPLIKIWKEDFQWSVPITLVSLLVGGSALAVAYQIAGVPGAAVFALPVLAIGYSFRMYANNMRVYVNSLENLNQELHDTNIGLLETLSAVIDAYDIFTYGHSAQVAAYAGLLAQKIGLPEQEQQTIVKAALIHDIGKIGVPEVIISKPGPLSENEFAIICRHPVIGAEIVSRMKGLHELVPLVRHHQEKFDGSGYPDRLCGDHIPLGARILTLADSLDAMYSDRTYKPARNSEEVIAEVRKCAGTHFDPQVVKAFLALVEEQGPEFFHNSAQLVDREVALANFRIKPDGARRFLKRSQME